MNLNSHRGNTARYIFGSFYLLYYLLRMNYKLLFINLMFLKKIQDPKIILKIMVFFNIAGNIKKNQFNGEKVKNIKILSATSKSRKLPILTM